MKYRGFKRNLIALFILQGSNYLLPLLTIPYLARTLGAENFGNILFVQAIIYYFVVLTDYGFNLSATHSASQLRDAKQLKKLHQLFSTVIIVKTGLMLSGLAFLTFYLYLINREHEDNILYLIAYIAVIGSVLHPVWFFQGIGLTDALALISIISRASMVALIFVLVKDSNDSVLALTLQSAGTLLAGIFSLIYLYQRNLIKPHLSSFSEMREEIHKGWHLFTSNIAVNLYTTTTTVILGIMTGPVSVAYFVSAEKIIKAFQGLFIPISQACYPHIARLTQKSEHQALRFIGNLALIQGSLTLCLGLLIFCTAEPLIMMVFGQGYAESADMLKWMAFLPFIVGLSNIFGIQTMLNFGMNALFSRILIISGIIHIIILFIFIQKYDEEGAAISILITESIITLTMALRLHRAGFITRMFQQNKVLYG